MLRDRPSLIPALLILEQRHKHFVDDPQHRYGSAIVNQYPRPLFLEAKMASTQRIHISVVGHIIFTTVSRHVAVGAPGTSLIRVNPTRS